MNGNKALRAELSQLGAIELGKAAIRRAARMRQLRCFVVEAFWTPGTPLDADKEDPTTGWRGLSVTFWSTPGSSLYASWIRVNLPGPSSNPAHEGNLGEMVNALLGVSWHQTGEPTLRTCNAHAN